MSVPGDAAPFGQEVPGCVRWISWQAAVMVNVYVPALGSAMDCGPNGNPPLELAGCELIDVIVTLVLGPVNEPPHPLLAPLNGGINAVPLIVICCGPATVNVSPPLALFVQVQSPHPVVSQQLLF